MPLTRRSILRNLGAISAARPLSAIGTALVLGCKEAPKPAPVVTPEPVISKIRIMLEGPWLFSHSEDTRLVATSLGDASHSCRYGLWDIPSNSILKPETMPASTKWEAASIEGSPTFQKVYKPAALAAKSVYLDPEILKGAIVIDRKPTDRVLSLPMPDQIQFAGRLLTATVTYKGATLGTAPFVATILTYNRPGGPATIPIKSGDTTIITATPANDLVFQMYHSGADPMTDVQHIEAAFANLMSQVQNDHKKSYAVALTVKNDCPNPSSIDKATDAELGIKPCPAPQTGGFHAMDSDVSSCAGGGLGVDSGN